MLPTPRASKSSARINPKVSAAGKNRTNRGQETPLASSLYEACLQSFNVVWELRKQNSDCVLGVLRDIGLTLIKGGKHTAFRRACPSLSCA
jgi:hypothetical protein